MKVGIVIFSVIKMFQGKQKRLPLPDNYVLISDNQNLKEKIENKLNQEIKLETNLESINKNVKTEIIFDSNFIDFKGIIHFMEMNKNKNLTFKTAPTNSDFLIGSNNSNDRGEVIVLS